jgi:hypothetical protein
MAGFAMYLRLENGEASGATVEETSTTQGGWVRGEDGNEYYIPGGTGSISSPVRNVRFRKAAGDLIQGILKP